jgi:hypothetical protein
LEHSTDRMMKTTVTTMMMNCYGYCYCFAKNGYPTIQVLDLASNY